MKLKRARLADDLNEKIAQRPGPMELVEKKILPVDSAVEDLVNGKCSSALLINSKLTVITQSSIAMHQAQFHPGLI